MSQATPLPPVIKGDADYRTYRPLLLDNGLTVLLVNDPQSKHFAASVSVHAGASSDPRALPGLAHFTEHMCFLGSKAYPEENEYKQFLAQHGGKSNASTSMTHTTYQFDVLADYGEKALDIFSNFFVSPLFTKSGTQREVQAVDSENSKNLVSDGRRRLQVLKSLADGEHHYSKFSTGNRITLPACASSDAAANDTENGADTEPGSPPEDSTHPLHDTLKIIGGGKYDENDQAEFVRSALLAFHKRHYRPKNMTAVLIGPQSLDELETWVVPRFGKIPDRWLEGGGEHNPNDDDADDATPLSQEKWQAMQAAAAEMVGVAVADAPPISVQAAEKVQHRPAFRPELQGGKWPVIVTTKPLQSVRKLVLMFPLPPTWHIPDRSPTSLLSHLFGHEGPGSAFAYLQDRGFISSLIAGNRVAGPDQTLFKIEVNMTEDGEDRWKEVARAIFDYGKLLCGVAEESLSKESNASEDGTCSDGSELRRIWDEVAALDRLHFHQTSPGAVYSFAPSVAQSISKYGTEMSLSAGSLLNENGDTLQLEEVLSFCQSIVPENCFIERCSDDAWKEMEARYEGGKESEEPGFGKQTEKWYGVEYFLSPVDDEDIHMWSIGPSDDSSLHLPAPNRYIPRSLDLCEDLPEEAKVQRIEKAIEPPNLVVNQPNGRLWWRLDDRYALPKASVTILLRTATAENKADEDGRWGFDATTAMRSNYVTSVFSQALAQDTYDAFLAGLGWSLSKSSAGFTLSCSGYSDRLSDLAIKLLSDFCQDESFIQQSYFTTTKDKQIRGLKSYFESRRADSLALYYRNMLLSSKGLGVEHNLELAEAMTLDDVLEQHKEIWADRDMVVEVFYTGNVAERDAKALFDKATSIVESTQTKALTEREAHPQYSPWVPGTFERRLVPGEDVELHFSSKNPKEENGAVIVTFQSQLEGFKGKALSSGESLQQSAAIRLLCKLVKEPCFNELRTKQQLGYIVSSYYDVDYSSRQPDLFEEQTGAVPLTTAVDSLVLFVLSRKETPVEVANRIDDFLLNFRSRLEDMDESEMSDHADSLARTLTKPIRKLGDEASINMARIRRYGPEALMEGSGHSEQDLGWANPQVMANALRSLDKTTLARVYDSLVLKKESRSRVVSFVYGKTFPLNLQPEKSGWIGGTHRALTMDDLLNKRKSLVAFDPSISYGEAGAGESLVRLLGKHKTTVRFAAAAAAAVGVGLWAMRGRGDEKKRN
ncbi:hypothetical protein ACHAXT_010223 [Thalassiosira profunda]